jgi:hypothetical protein
MIDNTMYFKNQSAILLVAIVYGPERNREVTGYWLMVNGDWSRKISGG